MSILDYAAKPRKPIWRDSCIGFSVLIVTALFWTSGWTGILNSVANRLPGDTISIVIYILPWIYLSVATCLMRIRWMVMLVGGAAFACMILASVMIGVNISLLTTGKIERHLVVPQLIHDGIVNSAGLVICEIWAYWRTRNK